MKRKAAVLGATPQFVRWAIERPCELRELDRTELPHSTFTQLRSLNELSRGHAENRVFEGVCFAVDVTRESPIEETLGFPTEEVTDLYGGENEVCNCCRSCEANINHIELKENSWAGCFGWLAADPTWQPSLNGSETNEVDERIIVFANEQIRVGVKSFKLLFGDLPANWHSLFLQSVFRDAQLEYLAEVLESVDREFSTRDSAGFHKASLACLTAGLDLHCEAVPSGFSDGQHWRIDSHCQRCRMPRTNEQQNCPACNAKGRFLPAVKRRVLGLRPYLQLDRILGSEKASQLTDRYLTHRQR